MADLLRRFLAQFFLSPFQIFILVPWLVALVSVRRGVMPLRSGGPLRRDENPALFRRNVVFCVVVGAAMFALNLLISWQVAARNR